MDAKVKELLEALQTAEASRFLVAPDLSFLDDYTTDELIAVAKLAEDAFENGDDELFSDAIFDAVRQRIEIGTPSHDYNKAIGSDVRGGKIDLEYNMGSLTQAHSTEDFRLWFTKHNLTALDLIIFCITEKLDGMSASLHYGDDGYLRIAYSRGNGFEGADMTRHIKNIPGLPKTAPAGTELRAEVIISLENFEIAREKVFRRDGSKFKNPRNMVSGLMNASTIDPIAYQYIDVIVYHDWNESTLSKEDQLKSFADMGFQIPRYKMVPATMLNDKDLTEILKFFKSTSKYELDGVVTEANDPAVRIKMSPSKETLNPEYSRKYKVIDERNNAIATVRYVELRVSKRGYIKPRVHYEPFSLPGITCTHSTGYNMKFIIDNGICPGAKVHMYRAGDVIPNILRCVEPGSYTREDFYEDLEDIGEWKWSKNDKGEEVDAILIGDHANVGLKLAEAFFTAIGVDGLKLGNLQKMFEVGFDTPEKIIKMSAEEMGFAIASQSTADKIHASLHKALKSNTEPVFMGATGLFGRGVGKRKIQALYNVFGDTMLTFELKDRIRITGVEGFADKTALKYLNGLPQYLDFYGEVLDYVEFVKPKVVEGGKLNGKKFVFTGHRSKELKQKLEDAGGEVLESFSTKADYVVAADPDENSTKMTKARKAGVKIISISDALDLLQ